MYLRWLVLLGAEANNAVFVYEHPQRVASQHQHIHPQVKLEAIDQQGLVQVLGGNDVHPLQVFQGLLQACRALHQLDASALHQKS